MLADHVSEQAIVAEMIMRALAVPATPFVGPPTSACLDWNVNPDALKDFSRAYLGKGASLIGRLPTGGAATPDTLGSRIYLHGLNASLSPEVRNDAIEATRQAAQFADRYFAGSRPEIMISEDGSVLLQWQGKSDGILLLFVGDGTVVYSRKSPESSYSESGFEQGLNVSPPWDFLSRVALLNAA